MGISKPSPTVVRTNRAQRQSQFTPWKKSSRRGSARVNTLPAFSSLSPASTTSQTSVLKKPRRQIHFSACAKAAVAVGTLIVALITLAVYNHRSDRLATWTALKDWREACEDDKVCFESYRFILTQTHLCYDNNHVYRRTVGRFRWIVSTHYQNHYQDHLTCQPNISPA